MSQDDTTYYRYFRRHDGTLDSIDFARRNGRLVPMFPPDVATTDPSQPETSSEEYTELETEVTAGLTDVEKRRFLRLADGMPILELAKEEKVSRQAIKCSIRRMIHKNEYCAISARLGVLKNRINQHQ